MFSVLKKKIKKIGMARICGHGSEIIGVLAFHAITDSGRVGVFVDYICTKKSCRRQGVARRMLSSVDKDIWLVVQSFGSAFRAYLKMDFVPVNRIAKYEHSALETCMFRAQRSSGHPYPYPVLTRSAMVQNDWECIIKFICENTNVSKSAARRLLAEYDPSMEYMIVADETAGSVR